MADRVLTQDERDLLRLTFHELDYSWDGDIQLYPFYSGRFMYGKQSFGFVVHDANIISYALGYMLRENMDLSLSLMKAFSTDSLGTDVIVYFPGFLWTEKNVATAEE